MTTTTRPAEFDRMLLAYMPYIRKIVAMRTPVSQREDMVQELVAAAMHHWQNFRPRSANPDHGFPTWLRWRLQDIVSRTKERARAAKTPKIIYRDKVPDMATPPAQPHAVDLRRAVDVAASMSPGTRDSVLMQAMGYSCEEIGAKHGIARGAVTMRAQSARRRMAANGVAG